MGWYIGTGMNRALGCSLWEMMVWKLTKIQNLEILIDRCFMCVRDGTGDLLVNCSVTNGLWDIGLYVESWEVIELIDGVINNGESRIKGK